MAFAIGVSISEFKHLNPTKLGYCLKGYNLQKKAKDEQMWTMGIYIQSAVATAIEHNFAGRKAKSQYIEKPFLQDSKFMQNKELTEEERKEMENHKLAMTLKIMQTNFELNKGRKEKSNEH